MKKHAILVVAAYVFVNAALVIPAKADYKQAVAFYNQKRFDKVIQELKTDLDRNPDWEFGHRLLGLSYLGLNNNALAVSALSRAAQLKSAAFSTYYGLGQAYFNMQKYENCINALAQGESFAAKEKDPARERARLFKLRGAAYYRTDRYGDAAEDLTNALRVDQSDWADFSMLGVCYFNLNRLDEAIPALEKALAMKPGQSAAIDVLAKVYLKKGIAALSAKQYPASSQALLKAKDYDPRNGYIYYNLAESYLFQKKYPEAEKAYLQAADLMPKSLEVFYRIGFVYEKQKKWDLALNAYKRAGEISPSQDIRDAVARVNENKKRK
jgi:tetratricopeptide (TPR) repeat protein